MGAVLTLQQNSRVEKKSPKYIGNQRLFVISWTGLKTQTF